MQIKLKDDITVNNVTVNETIKLGDTTIEQGDDNRITYKTEGGDTYNIATLEDGMDYAGGDAINRLGNQVNRMDSRMKKGIAGAAALAALHPLEFDPDDKLTFAAGVGNYRGENAAAIGAFYRADEKVMFSVGGTVGNGENLVNAGISFSLDRIYGNGDDRHKVERIRVNDENRKDRDVYGSRYEYFKQHPGANKT